MKKSGFFRRFGKTAVAVITAALIAACSFPGVEIEAEDVNPAPEGALTQKDYLALMKTRESHKVSVEELQKIAAGVAAGNGEARSAAAQSVITGVRQVPVSVNGRFAGFTPKGARSAVSAEPESEPVEIYEFSVGLAGSPEAESFVLGSTDDRIGNVLAITEGSLEEADETFVEVFNANLQEYIDATIEEYNGISEADIEAALGKALAEDVKGARALSNHWSGINLDGWQAYSYTSNFVAQKNPLLNTKWGQGSKGSYSVSDYAYNNYIRHLMGANYIAGCGPVAMAQIIAYHNYIKSVASYKPAPFNIANVGEWSGTYNLSQIRNMPAITNASPPQIKGQVAALMYQVGKLASANYQENNTGVNISGVKNAFETLGYSITNYAYATSLSETSNSSTIYYSTTPATIKSALDNNRPIYTRGQPSTGSGHAWVMDGYGSMTSYREYFYNAKTGATTYVTITLSNCLMVHCNLGWNGNANGWYTYGIFDTVNRTLLESNSSYGAGNYSTNTMILVPKRP
ncbi:MAG: C10 family peptidase [Spirochaetaceae bacterium]|jgi:hypothetical protein|nr:C10 family peptidase [Spirochaetaceae bacterium]